MRGLRLALGIAALVVAASAQADLKAYDSSKTNGLPGDLIRHAINLCPPIAVTPSRLEGRAFIEDGGSGAPTLSALMIEQHAITDLGPDLLVPIFGPGAFLFIAGHTTLDIDAPHVGTGDSAPGGEITWGVVSGWVGTSAIFCAASPVDLCFQGGGFPLPPPPGAPPSATYDLGTWNFDAVGDYQAQQPYIFRTSNGGLSNTQYDLRGVFVGSSLPALPLVALAVLAACLAVAGARRLRR